MCGILLVKSQSTIPLDKHLSVVRLLHRRGPDLTKYHYSNNIFVAQTVLHVTGTDSFYHNTSKDFFAYNGEIYDYRWFGRIDNDVELAYSTAKTRPSKFRYFDGPWAWCYVDGDQVLYATDPQGERLLYQYQDADILIVCSEVAPILEYIYAKPHVVPYQNKCWTMISQTPWKGITRCEPGRLYRNGQPAEQIDSIWSWIVPTATRTEQEILDEFEQCWQRACDITKVTIPATLSYSGGIDSNLILNHVPGLNLVSINTLGKDQIANNLAQFLTPAELERLTSVPVDTETWAHEYQQLIKQTRMPAQTWSYVGKWLVAKNTKTKVIYTGLAADELFGGYELYKNLQYTAHGSTSPYSSDDHEGIWSRCMDVYQGDARQATLLMDYWYQVVGVDAPGLDRLGGAWGRETRNPFMTKTMMTFALNLPWEYKVNTVTKPLLRKHFCRRWQPNLMLPKEGFAGHANDALPWLDIDFAPIGNRHSDWQHIAQQTFYEYTKH